MLIKSLFNTSTHFPLISSSPSFLQQPLDVSAVCPSCRGHSLSFHRIAGARDWDWTPSSASSLIMHYWGKYHSAALPDHIITPSLSPVWKQTLPFHTFGYLLPKPPVHTVGWITFSFPGLASLFPVFYQGKHEAFNPNTFMNPIHSICVWNGLSKPGTESKKKIISGLLLKVWPPTLS